jgi:hypothetical protein
MTNKIILCAAILLAATTTNAQDKKSKSNSFTSSADGEHCFNESSHVINIGIGYGGGRYYRYKGGIGYSYRVSPAFSLSYEQAIKEKIGPGFLGVGAYFGFQRASFQYDNYYYKGNQYYYRHSWNYMIVAARGAYHLDILNTKNAELYFGGIVGLRFQTYSYQSNSTDPDINLYRLSGRSVYPGGSLFVGGRWYFVPQAALFAELGYGISYLNGGVSIKF